MYNGIVVFILSEGSTILEMIFFCPELINWQLQEILNKYEIKGSVLADKAGLSRNAVSNLRRAKKMPRLTGDQLENLLNSLNACLYEQELKRGRSVDEIKFFGLSDLIRYSYDPTESK